MKVEEGTLHGDDNTRSADVAAELRAYSARKRTVSVGSSLFLFALSAVLAVRYPVLGFDLALGGVCGVVNMLLVMHNNERLVDGRRSRAMFAAGNMVRILLVGAIPVFAATHGPWWSMGIYFAGFFTPLGWYVLELHRWYRRGA